MASGESGESVESGERRATLQLLFVIKNHSASKLIIKRNLPFPLAFFSLCLSFCFLSLTRSLSVCLLFRTWYRVENLIYPSTSKLAFQFSIDGIGYDFGFQAWIFITNWHVSCLCLSVSSSLPPRQAHYARSCSLRRRSITQQRHMSANQNWNAIKHWQAHRHRFEMSKGAHTEGELLV